MINLPAPDASAAARSLSASNTVWLAAVSVAIYPWMFVAFHWCVTPGAGGMPAAPLSTMGTLSAALLLLAAFAVPLLNLLLAGGPRRAGGLISAQVRSRRFALLAFTAPTAYVFFGVLAYMAGSKIPDPWIWSPAWLLAGWLASRNLTAGTSVHQSRPSARLRVLHGVSGAIVAIYVLFHLFNHLFGLAGPEAHAAVMAIGRKVYRSTFIEPLLVAAMLFQIATGLRLAWTWSERLVERYRVFQVASGVFLSVFILGHMNSVFVFARTSLKIPTDWAFAAGLPAGLIHDAWNIRLVPHYALAVFLVLAHLCCGLRVVMLNHGVAAAAANRIWWTGAVLSALVSAAIMCGMTGLRLR
jgi:succinate dehydrogenase/fumarate reductase cytochrome b subunit